MFTYPGLLWFLPLAGLVILIHLVRFRRERILDWAAMDFLLVAAKQTRRKFVPLKLLLIAVRTLLIVMLVLLFAIPDLSKFANWFGYGSSCHYFIVLDDSMSTARQAGPKTVFQNEIELLNSILSEASSESTFTLVRTSCFSNESVQYDFDSVPLDDIGRKKIAEYIGHLTPSQNAISLFHALNTSIKDIEKIHEKGRVQIHVISDALQRDWSQVQESDQYLKWMENTEIDTRFHFTSPYESSNLVVKDIKMLPCVLACRLPINYEITITNTGTLRSSATEMGVYAEHGKCETIAIPDLAPGESFTNTIMIRFDTPGKKQLVFCLSHDSLDLDNIHYVSMTIAESLPILVLIPRHLSIDQREHYERILVSAISPGIFTGMKTEILMEHELTDEIPNRYAAVILCDIKCLKTTAKTLKKYIRQGGNLCLFPSDSETNITDSSELAVIDYLPVKTASLPDSVNHNEPVEIIKKHDPLFRLFEIAPEIRNDLHVMKAFSPDDVHSNNRENIVALVGKHQIFMAASQFGKGRILQYGTSPLSSWSNMSSWIGFPVLIQDSLAWLLSKEITERYVGQSLAFEDIPVNDSVNHSLHHFYYDENMSPVEQTISAENKEKMLYLPNTASNGIYEHYAGKEIRDSIAVNIDPTESQLTPANKEQLETILSHHGKYDFPLEKKASDGTHTSDTKTLMIVFILLLAISEMIFAGRYDSLMTRRNMP